MRYDTEGDAAPRVVAKGSGHVAERIVEIAREHGVYVHDDPDLAAILSKLDVDTEIPERLYRARSGGSRVCVPAKRALGCVEHVVERRWEHVGNNHGVGPRRWERISTVMGFVFWKKAMVFEWR